MGFTPLAPAVRAKTGVFKISSVQFGGPKRGGQWRLQITIPSAEFHLAFGTAEQFEILTGDGADEGRMMIRAADAGPFRFSAMKSVFVLRLPPSDTTPEIAFLGEDPERRHNGAGQMVIDLPEWAWKSGRWQEIQKAREIARRQGDAARGGKSGG